MTICQFEKAIYVPNTESENTRITIFLHHDTEKKTPIWQGAAKDLQYQNYLSDFLVVEMLVDNSPEFNHLPYYNKGKIITVV